MSKTNQQPKVKRGYFVFFPDAIQAGVYKVIKGVNHRDAKRYKGYWLYRKDKTVPLNDDLNIQIIERDFNDEWNNEWVNIDSVLVHDRSTGDVTILQEVLAEGSEESGPSDWYRTNNEIFPFEEVS